MPRPSRCLHLASRILLLAASGAYLLSLALPSLHVLDLRDWDPHVELKLGIELLFSVGAPVGRSSVERMLWSLNVIAFATPLLYRIRPKRPRALVPLLLACGVAWWWSATPCSPEDVTNAVVFWELDVGYFVWLGGLSGLVVATMLRWWASIAKQAEWRARATAPTARLGVDDVNVAHFSPATRALVFDAARLRDLLDADPDDPMVTGALYDWVTDLSRLPEAERAELERLGIPARDVNVAAGSLWHDVETSGHEHLERLDATLEAFLAASTSGGRSAGFR